MVLHHFQWDVDLYSDGFNNFDQKYVLTKLQLHFPIEFFFKSAFLSHWSAKGEHLYEFLGIEKTATQDDIKKAYRKVVYQKSLSIRKMIVKCNLLVLF